MADERYTPYPPGEEPEAERYSAKPPKPAPPLPAGIDPSLVEWDAQQEKYVPTKKYQAGKYHYEGDVTGAASFGRGMLDVFQGGAQMALYTAEDAGLLPKGTGDKYTRKMLEDMELYKQARDDNEEPGMDWWRLGGQTAPFLVGGPATAGVGGNVAAGAAFSALMPVEHERGQDVLGVTPDDGFWGDKTKTMATGGALGGLAPYAVPLVGRTAKWLTESGYRKLYSGLAHLSAGAKNPEEVKALVKPGFKKLGIDFDNLPVFTQEQVAEEAKRQIKAGQLDPAALARKVLLEEEGLQTTTGMITRNRHIVTMEKELSKTPGAGDIIEQIHRENGRTMGDKIHSFVKGLGLPDEEAYKITVGIEDAINKYGDDMQAEVTRLYNAGRELHGDTAIIPDRFVAALDDLGPLNKLNKELTHYLKDGELLTYNDIDRLRKRISAQRASVDGVVRNDARELARALDDDVVEQYGGEMGEAIGAARERFEVLQDGIVKKFLKKSGNTSTFTRSVSNGSIDPRDLGTLRQTLLDPPGPMSKEARDAARMEGMKQWKSLQGRVLRDMLEDVAEETPDGLIWNGTKLRKFLKQINRGGDRLNILFADEPHVPQFLNRLSEVSDEAFTLPPGTYINWSDSGTKIDNLARNYAYRATKSGPGLSMVSDLINMFAERRSRKVLEQMASGSTVVPGLPVWGQEAVGDFAARQVATAGRKAPYVGAAVGPEAKENLDVMGVAGDVRDAVMAPVNALRRR